MGGEGNVWLWLQTVSCAITMTITIIEFLTSMIERFNGSINPYTTMRRTNELRLRSSDLSGQSHWGTSTQAGASETPLDWQLKYICNIRLNIGVCIFLATQAKENCNQEPTIPYRKLYLYNYPEIYASPRMENAVKALESIISISALKAIEGAS